MEEKKKGRPATGKTVSSRKLMRDLMRQEAAIDGELEEARKQIDWERRNRAEKSLTAFIETYLVGQLFETSPSVKFQSVLEEMTKAVFQSRPYNIELPRGCGKTTAVQAMALWLLAYGRRKFLVIISSSARSGTLILKDLYRIVSSQSDFSQDFPDICLPYLKADGCVRGRQTYRGRSVELKCNAQDLYFPWIEGSPTCGSVVTCRGMGAGLRGLKVGMLRPDLVLLDDLQTDKSASSQTQVRKLLDYIRKDVMQLSSTRKIAVLMTSTPICPNDLCYEIEHDRAWHTTKHKAVQSWPDDYLLDEQKSKWAHYLRLYDLELAQDIPHEQSLDFYRQNREEMDRGSETFIERFSPEDGHVSAIQMLIEKRHTIGEEAFQSEMQMEPVVPKTALNISPQDVLSQIGSYRLLETPFKAQIVVAALDLNVSYAATLSIVAFQRDLTAHVLHHEVVPCSISMTLSDAVYNQKVYALLQTIGEKLKSFDVRLDGWMIDCGGRNWNAVVDFAKNSNRICGISACACAGRAAHQLADRPRNALRSMQERSVLCGDTAEQVVRGSGYRWVFFDSDFYKLRAQRAILQPKLSKTSLSLYFAPQSEHVSFATQVCNETLMDIQKRGSQQVYLWASKEPHDFLDTLAMAYAGASQLGLRYGNGSETGETRRVLRRKIRFV